MKLIARIANLIGKRDEQAAWTVWICCLTFSYVFIKYFSKGGCSLWEKNKHVTVFFVDSHSVSHHSASPVFSQKGFRIDIMHSERDAYS